MRVNEGGGPAPRASPGGGRAAAGVGRRRYAAAGCVLSESRTDTSLETPGSSMVTP